MSDWQPIETAPRNGDTIEANYGTPENPDTCLIAWSERPVCMLGHRAGGHKPGWSTAGPDVDRNLPVDPPNSWRPE
jgi:hypothetical protein